MFSEIVSAGNSFARDGGIAEGDGITSTSAGSIRRKSRYPGPLPLLTRDNAARHTAR